MARNLYKDLTRVLSGAMRPITERLECVQRDARETMHLIETIAGVPAKTLKANGERS